MHVGLEVESLNKNRAMEIYKIGGKPYNPTYLNSSHTHTALSLSLP